MSVTDIIIDMAKLITVSWRDTFWTLTTTMFNILMPKNLSTIQQIDAILGFIISGSQTLLSMNMKHYANLRASFLKFFSHPTFQLLLGLPPQNTPTAPPFNN